VRSDAALRTPQFNSACILKEATNGQSLAEAAEIHGGTQSHSGHSDPAVAVELSYGDHPGGVASRRATRMHAIGSTVQPFRMNLIACAESLGHLRMRLHKRPEPRALRLALTQLSRSGRRKTIRSRRDVQHAGPIACRIAQRRDHGISELPV
jgi:hypothetical protein